jgi:hypothetical protein
VEIERSTTTPKPTTVVNNCEWVRSIYDPSVIVQGDKHLDPGDVWMLAVEVTRDRFD